ncbi:hypothetical protein ACI4AF_28520, partial [Klebsiella pneumoniae]|uniref:hypothetical protein n=1 Tax=Klebsiella pneumoniae TaxID=573 RepID=UPI003853357A
VNPASAAAGYARSYPVTNDPRRLTGTGAINVAAGVINQAGGVANDTMLVYIHIAQNAAAVTLTVAGFLDETGAAVSLVFTGSTTGDTIFYPHLI